MGRRSDPATGLEKRSRSLFRRSVPALPALAVLVTAAQAQFAISPRAGLVHHIDGRVLVGDQALSKDAAQFRRVGEGEVLRTGDDGRCEVVLAPGSVLRVGSGSSIRMLSDDITDIRLELLDGSAIIDWDSGPEDTPIRLAHGDSQVELHKHGLYRLDSDRKNGDRLRVFDGEARIQHDGLQATARKGQAIRLGSGEVEGFDRKQTDSFDAWNRERGRFISKVNSLARSRNQRIVDGFRKLARHLGNGQSQRPLPLGRKGPHSFGGHRKRR